MKSSLKFLSLFVILIVSGDIYSQTANVKTIAVIDLETRGATSVGEAITLTDRLRSLLVRTKAFNVVDRGKMESILNEVGFQQSGCTSTECAVEVGRILNVQIMITGAIGKIGKVYTVDIASIDVQSSQILDSYIRTFKGEIEGLIDIMEEIADQLANIGKHGTKISDFGSISLACNPNGTAVFLDNENIGVAPLKKYNISVGIHTLKLIKDGYETKSGKINIEKGKVSKYNVTLVKKKGGKKWLWIGGSTIAIAGGTVYFFLVKKDSQETPEEKTGFPLPDGRP